MSIDPGGVAVIGGGPAGLMAATVLAAGGARADLYEAMPTVGRKFLVAGRGGLNLTHSEPLEPFARRYGERAGVFARWLEAFSPGDLRGFARELGIETVVGSSGRVFPADLAAAPMLRAWVRRLKAAGVRFHVRHRLASIAPRVALQSPAGEVTIEPDATILALGGASWGRLGSDGMWVPLLERNGVSLRPFVSANCGFEIAWSPVFRERAAGRPLKNVVLHAGDRSAAGEAMLTEYGIEGGAVYALSAALRERIAAEGRATLVIDLKPSLSLRAIAERLAKPREGRTLAAVLRRSLHLAPQAILLLHEVATADERTDPIRLAQRIRALPLSLCGIRPIEEAISSAGGIDFAALDERLMLKALPGVFVAGEMLDYDAPTGGYLLQAAFTTGALAARGALAWLAEAAGSGRLA